MSEGRIHVYETVVKPEWIDHNGHMNVAFFVLAFDEATDDVYERWGIGMDYPDTSGCSVFTLGINVDYLGELFEGDAIRIETTLVDYDAKRIHYFHRMNRSGPRQARCDQRVPVHERRPDGPKSPRPSPKRLPKNWRRMPAAPNRRRASGAHCAFGVRDEFEPGI